ncbi:MAG: GYD domain-containing protein [Betaproteobacteria bacterium]|nr:GYD domain-containing protein [Betaproteobacteria bacterium]
MTTFISLVSFTDQGIRNVKESPKRADAFKAMAKKLGVTVKEIYWTLGHYDLVIVLEGDDEAVTSALLKVGSLGNVRSETLRAFSAAQMGQIVGNIP